MSNTTEAEKYEVLEKIGHGSFGIIHKVRRKSDNKEMCRKEISYIRMSQKEREQLHAEFSILNSLRHPNIVAYFHREHLKPTQELHIYMEYCDGGDLSKVIKSLIAKNQFAEEEYVWSIFAQLVTALYRCHYGVDPPEVGKNFMGPANNTRPTGLRLKNQVMILHRDLKPENVFLGTDNAVKLGDFGLSKLMQSHDFASTYVGTPFYMSPEICAAERYTLHSDIWSLGCIMYELCARQPPFNAKTHLHLVQKIREGRFDPIPHVYSPELQNVIKSCLKTNPLHRPDTASLLQLPVVRLMRKEREVVEVGRILKLKEDAAAERAEKLRLQIATLELDKEHTRAAIEATVRREWEVKARLEIDRQIALEADKLRRKVEAEIHARVQAELEKHIRALAAAPPSGTTSPNDIPLSSLSSTASADDFPSATDLTSLSLDSPLPAPFPARKRTRTPFARARTTYDSPMDVAMASPSPMSITSLSLSPRRAAALDAAAALPNPQNLFAAAAAQRARWQPARLSPSPDDEPPLPLDADDDELPDLPSPTLPRQALDPFKLPPARPGLLRQNTAPLRRLGAPLSGKPALFPGQAATLDVPALVPFPSQAATLDAPALPLASRSPPNALSPNRRLSRVQVPLGEGAGSPTRKGAKAARGGEEMVKAVLVRNLPGETVGKGRTLVELSQARNGEAEREREVLWDPERDEMPSPFLARKGRWGR
ncbi:G2-specific serine/threonine protein kinase [Lambiella insularis]|nr:G2-specific serine/threonine protein kinase [Lambiella insularis]